MNNTVDINDSLTVEQKFAKVMLVLRRLRPFYSAIYETMEKVETKGVATIGVTTNKLLYNEDFVDSISFYEFVFIMLHEITHIALMHVVRRENRDPQLWNIACDLYANKVLADEFDIQPGQNTTKEDIRIDFPEAAVWCDSIDTTVEFTEEIYVKLEKQGKENNYFNDNKEALSTGGSTPGNSGDTGSKEPGETKSKSMESAKEHEYQFEYRGTLRNRYDSGTVFRTTIDQSEKEMDLINEGEDAGEKMQKAEKLINDAMVRVEMSGNSYGNEAGGLQTIVKNMLKSELDWKKLLRKYLIMTTSKDSSFNKPDKRMYYQNAIYPGLDSDGEGMVKGVKVCIDTSGSISDQDIQYFCGQVYGLTKQFKIEAELVYWDTSIESTGEFTGYKEFERVQCLGRGGTDPAVIFDYFDSKKCKIKPVVTLVFTDGYFSTEAITAKQRKKYKDTIWIMTRDHKSDFQPPFGKKALAKFNTAE